MAFPVTCKICSGGLLELSFLLPCLVASSNLLVSLKLACVNILEDSLETPLTVLLPRFSDACCASAGSERWAAERGEGAAFQESLCWCPGKLEPEVQVFLDSTTAGV